MLLDTYSNPTKEYEDAITTRTDVRPETQTSGYSFGKAQITLV